jgi:hypothetical protein
MLFLLVYYNKNYLSKKILKKYHWLINWKSKVGGLVILIGLDKNDTEII